MPSLQSGYCPSPARTSPTDNRGTSPTVREGSLFMRDFDDNEFPLAYLITFRCYGTWLQGMSADRIVVVPKGGPSAFRHDRASLRRRLNNSSIFPFNSITVSGRLSKTLFERYVFIADTRCMPSTQERIMCTQSSQLPKCQRRF